MNRVQSSLPVSQFATVVFAVGAILAASSNGRAAEADPPVGEKTPPQTLKVVANDQMEYVLIGPRQGVQPPSEGFKLLIALPGGDGREMFQPFVKLISERAVGDDYLVAQPLALKRQPNQYLVWPTRLLPSENQAFSTEEFVDAVIGEVKRKHKVNDRHLFTLSWSSGGPAAYAISLAEKTPVTGSYIVMSVFKPEDLPPLENAKGRVYYIEHSPTDRICPMRMAREAEKSLKDHGAILEFKTYNGGHTWRGDVFGRLRRGFQWLEEKTKRME